MYITHMCKYLTLDIESSKASNINSIHNIAMAIL